MSVVTSSSPATTALLTDHYELTMVQAARHAGTADRRSVFELFPRRLPEGRRYGVVAGVGRALDAIESFRFDPPALAMLEGVVEPDMLEWLASYRFSGDVWGYPEGEVYFPYSPLLVVRAPSPRRSCSRRCCSRSTTTTPRSPRPPPG